MTVVVIAIFNFSSLPGQCQDQLLLVGVKRILASFKFYLFTRSYSAISASSVVSREMVNFLIGFALLFSYTLRLSADPNLLTTLAVDIVKRSITF